MKTGNEDNEVNCMAAMLLYYPQRTTLDMGPTSVLPGTSYWCARRADRAAPPPPPTAAVGRRAAAVSRGRTYSTI